MRTSLDNSATIIMKYKGYEASIEYDEEDKIYVGHVNNIRDTVVFDHETLDGIQKVFHEDIDDYIEVCAYLGVEPNKPFNDHPAVLNKKE